jgi:hypothetical protein
MGDGGWGASAGACAAGVCKGELRPLANPR